MKQIFTMMFYSLPALICFVLPCQSEWVMIDSLDKQESQTRSFLRMECSANGEITSYLSGLGMGFNRIKHSTDSGNSWRIIDLDSVGLALGFEEYYAKSISHSVFKDSVWILVYSNNDMFAVSRDKGKSWDKLKTPFTGSKQLACDNSGNHSVFINYEDIWSSKYEFVTADIENGVFEHKTIPYKLKHHALYNMRLFSENLFYSFAQYPCEYAELLCIENSKWKVYEMHKGTNGICYYDSTTFFIIGEYNDYRFVEKTTDGGKTWERFYSVFSQARIGYIGLRMLTEKTGFLWVSSDEIYMTTDGGYTWDNYEDIDLSFGESIKDFQYTDGVLYVLTGDALYANRDLEIK